MSISGVVSKLKSVSKAKLSLVAIGVVAVAVALGLLLNMLFIAIPETKDYNSVTVGVSAEKIKGKLSGGENTPEGMKIVCDNKKAALYFNETTADIAVLDKVSGELWYSNPVDKESDTIATGANKGRLYSQVAIEYYDASGKSGSFNSYEDCIEQKALDFELIKDGIRVIYAMGDKKITREMLPAVVGKKRFEEKVLSNLDEEQKEDLLSFYELTSIEESSKNNAEKYKELYTALGKSEKCYFLDLYTADYKYDDVYELVFEAAGYTATDVAEDNKAAGYNIEVEAFRQISVPVEYTLSEGDLKAQVPASDIICPAGLYLTKISLLPFFGASSMKDNGYMIVPDGSGAIINYNNGRVDAAGYTLPIYGAEPALDQVQAKFVEPYAMLPVFALVNEGRSGMLAIIESGETHASVLAQISGISTGYNQLYPVFEVLPKDVMEVHSNATQIVTNVYQEKPYDGYISVRYKFEGADADYSSIAALYRDYLIKNGTLKNQKTTRKMAVSLTSKVTVEDSFMGIPYSAEKTLTSFGDAQKIVEKMKALGIDVMSVGIKSWFGGGTEHDAVNGKVKLASGLGGKKDLRALGATLGEGELALGADLIRTYKGYPQFNAFSYAVRRITNNIKRVDRYDSATYMPSENRTPYYLLSPKYFDSVLQDFAKSVNSLGVDALWLSDAGSVLSSDFKVGSTVDRETSKQYIVSALEKLDKNKSIILERPNLYAIAFCDTAVNIPMSSSGSNLLNRDIPFVQMVLSGSLNYTGAAINRNGNTRYNMLRAVETGADLYYEWIYAENTVVGGYKGAQAKSLYSMYYGNWIEDAAAFYCRVKDELKSVEGKSITAHKAISEDVSLTFYGDIAVAVNYGDTAVSVEGTQIPAHDFKVLGGNS